MEEKKKDRTVAWEIKSDVLSASVVKESDEKDTIAEIVLSGYKVVTKGKRRMSVPITGAEVKAKVWVMNRVNVGDGDYTIVGEVLSSNADGNDDKKKGSVVVNGTAFRTGAYVRFYWSSGLTWGGVYSVDTPDDKTIEFAKPLSHAMPDDDWVQFRRPGTGMEETVTTMSDKIVEDDYITDNGYDDGPEVQSA